MPPCIPLSINNHQFVLLHTIFLSLHVSCAMLGASRSLHLSFPLISLVLFAVHNKLDPSIPCLGEKHTPLSPRMLIILMLIFVEWSLLFLVVVLFSSCFHVYL